MSPAGESVNVLARERKDLGPVGDICFRVRVVLFSALKRTNQKVKSVRTP